MTTTQMLRLTILGAVALALAACGSKPPGCADPETVATAKQMLVDAAREAAGRRAADDPDGWLQKFYDGLKVEIVGVVSEGYREDTKKQQCKGTLKFATVMGNTAERSTSFSTQLTVDQKSRFLLEVQEFEPFAISVGKSAQEYYFANRWAGTWNGMYSCTGIAGADGGPRGPYSMPVTMIVTGTAAKFERTTQGGGVEGFEGDMASTMFGQPVTLVGTGRNTADDMWRTVLTGTVQGKVLRATGDVRPAYGGDASQALRQCRLDVTLGAPMLQQGTAKAEGPSSSTAQTAIATLSAASHVTPVTTAGTGQPSAVSEPAVAAIAAPATTTSRQPNLCSPGEEVMFSCAAGKKVISLCSRDLTSTGGNVYYRVGLEGKSPEMVYPDSAVPGRQAFKSGTNDYVGGTATFLTFEKGDYRYVIFSGSGKGWTKEGVVVQKAGKRIADLRCNGDAATTFQTSDALSKGFAGDRVPFELP